MFLMCDEVSFALNGPLNLRRFISLLKSSIFTAVTLPTGRTYIITESRLTNIYGKLIKTNLSNIAHIQKSHESSHAACHKKQYSQGLLEINWH